MTRTPLDRRSSRRRTRVPRGTIIVIRGPLGVGKTTIARAVARRLGGRYLSIDRILDAHRLVRWRRGRIALRSFVRANTIALGDMARPHRARGPVVLDGNFYYLGQIRDLARRARFEPLTFELRAPVAVCVARDAGRARSYGTEATETVYRMNARRPFGEAIDATRPSSRVVTEIVARVRRAGSAQKGGRRPRGPPASGQTVRLR